MEGSGTCHSQDRILMMLMVSLDLDSEYPGVDELIVKVRDRYQVLYTRRAVRQKRMRAKFAAPDHIKTCATLSSSNAAPALCTHCLLRCVTPFP
jgi:hypothetical protein